MRQQIIYLPQRHITTLTDSADTPQPPRLHAQTPTPTGDDSARHPQHPATTPQLARAPDVHAQLEHVIAAWPNLPAAIRGQILALIQKHEQRLGEVL